MIILAFILAALTWEDYPDQDWWPGFVREVSRTDSYEEYLDNRGVELQDNGMLPLTAPAADWKLYHHAHPDWTYNPECESFSKRGPQRRTLVIELEVR